MLFEDSITNFEIVAVVAVEGTLARAAARLRLPPGEVLDCLEALERAHGSPLFERIGKRMDLTLLGERILQSRRAALETIMLAERRSRPESESTTGLLRLQVDWSARCLWLPALTKHMSSTLPGVELQISSGSTRSMRNDLLMHEVDLTLGALEPGELAGLRVAHRETEELVALVSADHDWARRKYVTADDFGEQHVVIGDAPYERSALARLLLAPAQVRPRRISLIHSVALGTTLAAAGQVVAIVPRRAFAQWGSVIPGTFAVQLTADGLFHDVGIATRAERQAGYVERVIQLLATSPCSGAISWTPAGPGSA